MNENINILTSLAGGAIFFFLLYNTDFRQAKKAKSKSLKPKFLALATFLITVMFYIYLSRSRCDIELFHKCFIILLFSVIGIIDWRYRIIPNALTATILIITVLYFVYSRDFQSNRIIFSVIIFTLFVVVKELFLFTKGINIIGNGDIKLLFVIALNIDVYITLGIVWSAALLGLLFAFVINGFSIKKSRTYLIPLGSFLSISFITLYMFNLNNNTVLEFIGR
jgi:Flp pilus assembly protein protease CpaA